MITGPRSESRALVLSFFLLAALATGCAPVRISGKNGTSHYLIVGFGLVSVDKQSASAATIVRSRSLGATVTDSPVLKASLGYASGTTVAIPNNASDVRIEIGQKRGVLKVDCTAAHLQSETRKTNE